LINLGFLLRENLLLYSSYLPLGVPNWTVIYINTSANSKAITDIREHKTEKLLGTKFTHIPHDEEGEDPLRDSYTFVKRHPHAAAEHMDKCKHLLSVLYHVHGALVGEIQSPVEEITESTPTPWCTGETSGPP
jgi:hypothetical protein